ncbi:MAG: LuxR C-terminal-related transcriptional regulator [Solirubrobacterales bacterium]
MLQPENMRTGDLTKRQREVLERLEQGYGAKQIARDLGVTRNAVYQHIERLRRQGALAETYTPSGQPPRGAAAVGSVALAPAAAPRESVLAKLRELAAAGQADEGAEYASAIETAIATGDAVGLAYELGRLDASGRSGLPVDLVESALRRLSVLDGVDASGD